VGSASPVNSLAAANNMAKRFTDTDKFIDPWFRRLSTQNKLLWDWMLCNCDHAGIITIDFEFVEMVLRERFDDRVLDEHFSERVIKLSPAKYFIPKFLRFQYGKLNPQSKVHASVIQRLRDEGIIYNDSDSIKEIENNARVIEYGKGMDTIKAKEKAKAKVITSSFSLKESNTELVNTNPPTEKTKPTGPLQEFSANSLAAALLQDVTHEAQKAWVDLYQDRAWIAFELSKAATWLTVNPDKAPKSRTGRFLTNWLSRGWEAHRKTLPSKSSAQSHRTQSTITDQEMQRARELGII
jgi:hypothetical protein